MPQLTKNIANALFAGALAALFAFPGAASAQQGPGGYPSRPIRFIVPQTPSGMVDTVARAVAQQLSERFGQPVIVENRAGANGAIGYEAAARSAPDGYTLLMVHQAGLVIAAALRKTLPYHPVRDFTSVSLLLETPYYLLVHPAVPARSVKELIDLAAARPGVLNYGSTGLGSGQHLFMERFKTLARVNLVHVPYKGSSQLSNDLIAGQVQLMLQSPAFSVAQARNGKVRALAVTGLRRTQAMPEVPTVSESGVPGFEASTWWGLSGPAGVPRPIVDRLNREVVDYLGSPPVRDKFAELNIDLVPSTPEALTERVRKELPVFAKVMRDAGIEPE